MDKTRVLIVDDHPIFRDGIAQLLQREADFEVVGQAGDGEEVVRMVGEMSPDIVLMDIEMPRMDGLEATRQMGASHPKTSVIVLTVHDEGEYVAAFLDAGVGGYLLKTTYGKELVQAIRAARNGVFVLDANIRNSVLRAFATRSNKVTPVDSGEKLSDREIDVAKLVAQGMTNDEITRKLNVSLRTVKGYLSDIFSKLDVGSRTEAISACLRNGIISVDDLS